MEKVLAHGAAAPWIERFGREQVKRAVRETLSRQPEAEIERILERAGERLEREFASRLIPVINATGVYLHTNLGRSPLSEEARRAVAEVAGRYSALEYDLKSGERGDRQEHVRDLLRRLLGTEDALAVNNNAAAVFLVLAALARDRDVLVSRGELVAIGGSFRIPDILAASGARLLEVGTTNRTTREDYVRAFRPSVAAILTVHPSNYRISGFTARPAPREIAGLAREAGIPWIHDQGSGCLTSLAPWGIEGEPTVAEALAAGAAIVTFSGDKLLGGPQAGVIAGGADLVERLARHPIARAVRPDKFTLAALEATLSEWLRRGPEGLPIYRLAGADREELRRRATAICRQAGGSTVRLAVRDSRAVFGGGSTPDRSVPSFAIEVKRPGLSASDLHGRLRLGSPPIIGRIEEHALLVDLAAVFPEEDRLIIEALRRLLLDR